MTPETPTKVIEIQAPMGPEREVISARVKVQKEVNRGCQQLQWG